MNRQLLITEDGSHTLFVPSLNENYHSTHGAIQESQHVFIEAGLKQSTKTKLTVFEVGYGTGLNAFLTYLEAERLGKTVHYIGIEKFPINEEEHKLLNYASLINTAQQPLFDILFTSKWGLSQQVSPFFKLHKAEADVNQLPFTNFPMFDLIYFDAFAPSKQGEMWDKELFKHIYDHSNHGAIFVTYCAKGEVRRNLQSVGFQVERIPGPPGKMEMLRAFKFH